MEGRNDTPWGFERMAGQNEAKPQTTTFPRGRGPLGRRRRRRRCGFRFIFASLWPAVFSKAPIA
eukprot:9281163-Heterocapsa_arctica.AAC.1